MKCTTQWRWVADHFSHWARYFSNSARDAFNGAGSDCWGVLRSCLYQGSKTKKEEIDASSIYSSYWPCSAHIPHRWKGSKVGRPRVGKLRWPSARGHQRSPCRKPCWPWETLHRTSHSSAPTLKWWKMITGNKEGEEEEELSSEGGCIAPGNIFFPNICAHCVRW